jgi:hypothetical protein
MRTRLFFIFLCAVLWIIPGHAQQTEDLSGRWYYEVKNTPYGNFYGVIILKKQNEAYAGQIINKAGKKFKVDVVRVKGNRMVFLSNVEDTNSTFNCQFKGDSLLATVEVKGDKFLYKLKAKRKGALSGS